MGIQFRGFDSTRARSSNINYFQKLILFFLIFLYIFAPRFDFKFIVHSGFISVALIAILVTIRQRKISFLPKPLIAVATFNLFIALYYMVFATLYGNDPLDVIFICISVFVSLLFGWMVASQLYCYENDACNLINELIVIIVFAAFVNSSVILVEFSFPEIKSIIESYLLQVQNANIDYAEHPFRLRGIASSGGASLSIFNAIAIIFTIYLVVNKKVTAGLGFLAALIIMCSNIFTGRTGLILGLIFTAVLLFIVLIQSYRSGRFGVLRSIGMATFIFVLLSFLLDYDLDPEAARWAFEWVDNMGEGRVESASTDSLLSMLFLPDDPFHLMFGIGFFEGVGKLYPRTDSGYIKSVLAIGLPLSILVYSAIIFIFFQITKISLKFFSLVASISVILLLVEIKEPFLYQNFVARAIFLLSGAAMFLLCKRRSIRKQALDDARNF